MLETNSYFEGRVKSIAVDNQDGIATVGVMAVGDYEFGTSSDEYMTIISGALTVLLPDDIEWKTYGKGETFIVGKDQRFKLEVKEQTAYLCVYK